MSILILGCSGKANLVPKNCLDASSSKEAFLLFGFTSVIENTAEKVQV